MYYQINSQAGRNYIYGKVYIWATGPTRWELSQLGIFLLPLYGMLVHCRVSPALDLLVPICTPGRREALWELSVLPKNTTQYPRPGLEPRPLNPE